MDGIWILVGMYCLMVSAMVQQILEWKYLQKQVEEKTNAIEKMTLSTMISIANTVDEKDRYRPGHSLKVAECVRDIARKMGFREAEIHQIYYVALLHDIGKIAIPDKILNKPGKLNEEEYRVMMQHAQMGAEIIKDIQALPQAYDGVCYHHERWDGTGYPVGLKGEEIPKEAQITSVADVFDALVSRRCYKDAWTIEQAYDEMVAQSGTQFGPDVIEAFKRRFEDFKRIAEIYKE